MEQFEDLPADDPWDEFSAMSRSRLWLTRDETKELGQELYDLIERFRKGRTATSHPAGTRAVTTLVAVVPTGKPPQES
jgi:hypothetical protein